MRRIVIVFAMFAGGFGAAEGQHVHEPSMYASQTDSGIAALSQEEYDELLAGAGMGLARAAELNHYPGPLHVLELADSLHLTAEQRSEVERVRAAMLEAAIDLGRRIIEAEQEMDMRFQHGHADGEFVRQATASIAVLQGELRYTHLAAHIELKQLLEPDQIATYDRLRGYTPPERKP